HDVAKAFYGVILETLGKQDMTETRRNEVGAEAGLGIDSIIRTMKIVNWETNTDVQNQMRNIIEDYLFELKSKHRVSLAFEDIDAIKGALSHMTKTPSKIPADAAITYNGETISFGLVRTKTTRLSISVYPNLTIEAKALRGKSLAQIQARVT